MYTNDYFQSLINDLAACKTFEEYFNLFSQLDESLMARRQTEILKVLSYTSSRWSPETFKNLQSIVTCRSIVHKLEQRLY